METWQLVTAPANKISATISSQPGAHNDVRRFLSSLPSAARPIIAFNGLQISASVYI